MTRKKVNDPEDLLSRNLIIRVAESTYNRLEKLRKDSKNLSIAAVARKILSGQKINLYHQRRLEAINSNVKINVYNCFLTEGDLNRFISGHKIAINALDFSSDVPLKFDSICREYQIPVLHPYNIGWAGLVAVVTAEGSCMDVISRDEKKISEIDFVEYALGHLEFWGNPQYWANEVLASYKEEQGNIPPPQLAVGSWTVSAMCTTIMFKIANHMKYKNVNMLFLILLAHINFRST